MSIDIDEFVQHYVVTLIWQAPEEDDGSNLDEYGIEDFDPESLAAIKRDCELFIAKAGPGLNRIETGQAAHDFCLTRNDHGTGFWDRGLGFLGGFLTDICERTSPMHVYAENGTVFVDHC